LGNTPSCADSITLITLLCQYAPTALDSSLPAVSEFLAGACGLLRYLAEI
jgi:hypothetical protein